MKITLYTLILFVSTSFTPNLNAIEASSIEKITVEISARIKNDLEHRDLKKDGPLNPFVIAKDFGLVSVNSYYDRLFPIGSGGQNMVEARINKNLRTLSFSKHHNRESQLSEIFCLKTAMDSEKNQLKEGMESQCIEIATVAKDLPVGNSYGKSSQRNHAALPSFDYNLSNNNGTLEIKPVIYEGGSTSAGRYNQAIYIWNFKDVISKDRQEYWNKREALAQSIGNETRSPIATKNNGKLSVEELVSQFKEAQLFRYSVVPRDMDVAKARARLNSLSPSSKENATKVLDAIKKFQDLNEVQIKIADTNGLYGNDEEKAKYFRCLKNAHTNECKEFRKRNDELSGIRYKDWDFNRLETQKDELVNHIDKIFSRMIGQIDKDPAIVDFIIDTAPQEERRQPLQQSEGSGRP